MLIVLGYGGQVLALGHGICGILSVKYGYGHHTLDVPKATYPQRQKVSLHYHHHQQTPPTSLPSNLASSLTPTGRLRSQHNLGHRLLPLPHLPNPPLQTRLHPKMVPTRLQLRHLRLHRLRHLHRPRRRLLRPARQRKLDSWRQTHHLC